MQQQKIKKNIAKNNENKIISYKTIYFLWWPHATLNPPPRCLIYFSLHLSSPEKLNPPWTCEPAIITFSAENICGFDESENIHDFFYFNRQSTSNSWFFKFFEMNLIFRIQKKIAIFSSYWHMATFPVNTYNFLYSSVVSITFIITFT